MAVLPDPAASRAVLIGTSRYAHLEQIPAVANNLSALAEALCAPLSWGLGIVIYRWLPDFPSGQGFLQPLADGRLIRSTGNTNIAELDDPAIDHLLDTAIAEQDPEKAGSDYARINRRISDSAAFLPILFEKSVIWRGSRLTNVYTGGPWQGRYDYVSLGVSE
ncbi:hypothetical protein [Streptomyces malaysiensis]|uniref:Uncharacterized protein n=1 Tax=Streptomyces malaysiensis subsp. samsunensis TaxID=459658 RepID=A0A9X2M2C9_STRMQ|nr:hypothetical protein [Streptomyces samsunensis]MCQ8834007.1 hypothetical protein [Streptomyces samsunensis]